MRNLTEDFFYAAKYERPEKLRVLLDTKTLPIDVRDEQDRTALMLAIMSRNDATAKLLIEYGSDIEAKSDGLTPLGYAALFDREIMLRYLLDKGAKIDVQTVNGSTPLMFAATSQSPNNLRTLLAWGANTKLVDNTGQTALEMAKERQHAANVVLFAEIEIKKKQRFEKNIAMLDRMTRRRNRLANKNKAIY